MVGYSYNSDRLNLCMLTDHTIFNHINQLVWCHHNLIVSKKTLRQN